ncbi:unnamed protein product, partial [Effrenium voratum]
RSATPRPPGPLAPPPPPPPPRVGRSMMQATQFSPECHWKAEGGVSSGCGAGDAMDGPASPESRATELSQRLGAAPPICKYRGFIPASRGLCGETFTQQCFSARETLRQSGGGIPLEAWTRNGVGTAGRIVCGGRGLRPDLQEQHTVQECRAGLDALLTARGSASSYMLSQELPKAQKESSNVSYMPPLEPRRRVDPSTMEAAGARSLTRRFQKLRLENYRREVLDSIRRDEPNAGRR